MDTLDKYELIISKIQEMCTSTVAMAPYPINGISVTTVSYKPGKKGKKKRKNKKERLIQIRKAIVEELTRGNNMSIIETMYELAELCEAMYWGGKEVSPDTFRANLDAVRGKAAEKLAKWEAEHNKGAMDKVKDGFQNFIKRFRGSIGSKHKESINKLIDGMSAIKGNKESINCTLTEEEEEKKKHWTQHQPSNTNMYYVNKFGPGKNMNNYQRGRYKLRGSYRNYKTNKELPKHLQDEDLMNRAIDILNHAYSQKGAGIGKAFAEAQKAGIPRGVFHYLIQQRKQGGTN